jgi:tRNA G18 (ribose-2'-O)-methylase SpoU
LPTVQIERIDDPADPRVADYRDVADPELRRRRGLFVVEGRDIARMLLESRFAAVSVLGTEPALADLRDRLSARPGVRVLVAAARVVRVIAGYKFHRGCLALGQRGADPAPAMLVDPPGARLLVAMEDVTNPDNVGGIFRNARAFGVDAVLLSTRCADPLYRKSIRVSTGSSLVVPFARIDDWADGLGRLREAGYTLVALTPDAGAMDIGRLEAAPWLAGRVALVVGAEDHGLSAETRARADVRARIPMAAGADSLNVATAAGIALHRIARRTGPPT